MTGTRGGTAHVTTTVPCLSCGRPLAAVEVSSLGQAEPTYIAAESCCPTPDELKARADRAWLDRHRRLASES